MESESADIINTDLKFYPSFGSVLGQSISINSLPSIKFFNFSILGLQLHIHNYQVHNNYQVLRNVPNKRVQAWLISKKSSEHNTRECKKEIKID